MCPRKFFVKAEDYKQHIASKVWLPLNTRPFAVCTCCYVLFGFPETFKSKTASSKW
jgi:hypothetical protein